MLMTVFVVLMLLWLLGGGYGYYSPAGFAFPGYAGGVLLPWVCVAILGYKVLGGG